MRVQREQRSRGRGGVIWRAVALLLVAGLAASAPGSATAGWVDAWAAQKTETSPGYFEGQQRGYYTGGGFSARWNLQNDYLWSVTAPKLKTGCGGIDAFMGGFSFLSRDSIKAGRKRRRASSERS
jgi:conjugative transfer pilus assembly protein TraH